jgi:excisionase family DNA binding protein
MLEQSKTNKTEVKNEALYLVSSNDIDTIKGQLSQIQSQIRPLIEQDFSSQFIESKKVPKLLGISLKTWQNYRDKGEIPFIQFGSKIWVKRSDLESFMEANYINKKGLNI